MLQAAVAFAAAVGVMGAAHGARTTDRSLGTLVGCPSEESACLWAGENGDVVDSHAMRELFIQLNDVGTSNEEAYRRNLQTHMTYIEAVNKYAKTLGHEFSYHMGVNERHLTVPLNQKLRPEEFVDQEVLSDRSRRLEAEATNSSSSGSTYWNWCDAENSLGHSACSSVKSQKSCGSCWSFAAADAIETAVVIAENASAAVALSPQQFLTCSTLEMTKTFEYCWASDSGVDGATWMQSEIKWESQNSGCNGGMTHAAFQDAAQNGWGLVTELTMPYDDSSSGSSSASNTSSVCSSNSNNSAASISGWEQIVGTDCSTSSNCTLLLRSALEQQPIAVAITSNGGFSSYAGGFYSCPNNGVLSSKNDLNHAILLVGYGTDSSVGDYWILKNSYGSSWGDSGFMKLIADSKVNCGLNVFPVIPTGAKAGAQAATSIDSGGDKVFVGLSPTAWIIVAAAATTFTTATTALGVFVSHRKLKALRNKSAASFVLTPTNAR